MTVKQGVQEFVYVSHAHYLCTNLHHLSVCDALVLPRKYPEIAGPQCRYHLVHANVMHSKLKVKVQKYEQHSKHPQRIICVICGV